LKIYNIIITKGLKDWLSIYLWMYSGELEVQAKRKALAVLRDEINGLLNSSRDLSTLFASIMKGDEKDVQMCLIRLTSAEKNIENLSGKITREVAGIGSLMVSREDVLRTVYIMDDIAGFITGTAFRLSNLRLSSLRKGKFDDDMRQLLGMVIDTIFKLNEMARALSINATSTIELGQEIQKIERQIDDKYRNIIIKVLTEATVTKDILLLKDAVESVEGMADKCKDASDSITILALSI
jgi:predicted phosphate transport protein (TIGR00153 family)